jgi:hypothetical protein
MTKFVLTIFFIVVSYIGTWAQGPDGPFGHGHPHGGDDEAWRERKERFKAEKVAYISNELNLSVQKAQKFWPIYNQYDVLLDSIGEKRRKNMDMKRLDDISGFSEQECKDMMINSFEIDSKELEIRKKYYDELCKIFTQKEIMQYYHAEHEFRRNAMRQFKGASFGKSFKNN